MIRRATMRWLPLLLAAMPAGAQAGVRASYTLVDEVKPFDVEIADNGDASFSLRGDSDRVAVVGGHVYVVTSGDDGIEVVKVLDMAAALRTTGVPPIDDEDGDIAKAPPPPKALVITPVGTKVVEGRSGRIYRLAGLDVTHPKASIDVTTLPDPAFAGVGAAIQTVFAEAGAILTLVSEKLPAAAPWLASFGRIMKLGTPLAMNGVYRLRMIETARIPPETIALPGPPKSPAALIARIRRDTPGS